MAGHARLKFVMTECSKTQIRLTGLICKEGPKLCGSFVNLFPEKRKLKWTKANYVQNPTNNHLHHHPESGLKKKKECLLENEKRVA